MILKLPSLVYKASLASFIFVSLWAVVCCTETGLGGINMEGDPAPNSKRAPFNAWAGKRNSEKLPYFSENEKRAAFSSWAGKRDSWQDDDVVGDVYSVEEPEINDINDVTSNDKRAPFSSWAGKRAAFSSWAGKRSTSLREQLQLINHLLEQAVARVVRKRMFNAWAGKRSEQTNEQQDHEVTRRKFSAWHGK